MKFWLKVLLLTAAPALIVLCLFAGSAAATGAILCQNTATPCTDYPVGTELKLNLTSGTSLKTKGGEGELVGECSGSTMTGKTVNTGSETTPVEVALSSLSFTGCTCSTTTIKPGRLIIERIPGTRNGRVRWTEFEFKCVGGGLGTECIYGSEASKGIVLKGGAEPALNLEATVIPKKSGFGICASFYWSGTYTISAPKPLYVGGPSSEVFSGAGILCKFPPFEEFACAPFAEPPNYGAGTALTAKLKAGTTSILEAGFPSLECEGSSMNGEILDGGSATEPVVGVLSAWTFSGCNCAVSVLKSGNFGVDWTSGSNGTLALSGFEIKANCGGKECTFGSSVKEGITLFGGEPAVIQAASAPIPKKSGIAECNSTAKWTAEYEVTTPEALWVAEG